MGNEVGFTQAESNTLLIQQLIRDAKLDFLKMGRALIVNQENAYWSSVGYESFKSFIEELGIGDYTWVTRLMNITRLVGSQLTEQDVLEIGVSKCALLLPAHKKGELTEEIIELAKDAPFSELRAELTGKEYEPTEHFLICPRCGAEVPIKGKKGG